MASPNGRRLVMLCALTQLQIPSALHAVRSLQQHVPPEFRPLPTAIDGQRSQCHAITMMGAEEDNVADVASAFMETPRATSGKAAFDGTTWSVLMRMNEGGSTIFTVQLLEDDSCRFSDSELLGGWECQRDWVVIEKPKGLFDQTLFFSGRLTPPSSEKPKWRLVDGIVQRSNYTDVAAADPASSSSGSGSGSESDGDVSVELAEIGTFGANEFEEALLTAMPRFQKDETDEDEERAPR